MKIETIHSYLVNPDKGLEKTSEIRGTKVHMKGNLFEMLHEIFYNSIQDCKYEIAFKHNEDGGQQNDCKDLIVNYTNSGLYDDGLKIALHLQNQTTKRSGLGLLFLIIGKHRNKKRIVISRFPADNGILAEESKNALNVKFVERIFMKSAKAYKSAVYEGINPDINFWKGRAIDKQINSDLTISDYWIKYFLKSDFATTGERGTKRLAAALRDAINSSGTTIEIKEEITAALKLAEGQDGQIISASSFLSRLGLSKESKEAVQSKMKKSLFREQFKMIYNELNRLIAFKTVELDNGAFLSARATEFDKVFKKKDINQETEYKTIGKITSERVKKR
ncbi:MAG: hypothetical protein ACPH06_07860 [Flavobacteriaceae bacterium]